MTPQELIRRYQTQRDMLHYLRTDDAQDPVTAHIIVWTITPDIALTLSMPKLQTLLYEFHTLLAQVEPELQRVDLVGIDGIVRKLNLIAIVRVPRESPNQ